VDSRPAAILGDDAREQKLCPGFYSTLQITPQGLFALNGFEKGFEVTGTE